jgi:formate dehydrogenase subunit delta
MNHGRLVTMANQIATFFATQKDEDPADATARHIASFWDPRMRSGLHRLVQEGGAGLDPVALAAARRLANNTPAGQA